MCECVIFQPSTDDEDLPVDDNGDRRPTGICVERGMNIREEGRRISVIVNGFGQCKIPLKKRRCWR
jgi:hypothetical protein